MPTSGKQTIIIDTQESVLNISTRKSGVSALSVMYLATIANS